MKTSNGIAALAAALSKAQAAMRGAAKDSQNPHFKSKYADLASVWEACREALTANGLSVIQTTEPSGRDEVIVETALLHDSGEWISSRLAMPVQKADAQGFGSALTYARRYSLAAMVGVAPEDDDGNAATKAAPSTINEGQVSTLTDLLDAAGADVPRFLKHFRIRKLSEMPAADYDNAVAALKAKMGAGDE
jgi:hypothetical protein